MSNQQTEIEHARTLLEQHRAGLRHLREQQATYGAGEARLSLLNQIEEAQKAIRTVKATLRRLREEPTHANGDPPEDTIPFAKDILTRYPQPIAQTCAQFNEARNEREQFIALDRLTVHLTKYLAAIFIGQARRDRLPEYPLPGSLDWMAYPVLENWTAAVQQLSQIYDKSAWRAKWCLPGLLEACTKPLLNRAELIDVIDYLTRQLDRKGLDEPSVIDLLQLLAWYRDKEWQDAPETYAADKSELLILRLQPALVTILNELEVLRRYPLVYVEWAESIDTEIRLRVVKFMGLFTEEITPTHKPPLVVGKADTPPVEPRQLYVANAYGPQLRLHAFFIIHRWEMYQLARHQPTKFIEFRSCSRGTHFQPPPEAKMFHTSWSVGELHPPSTGDIPPILGEENTLPDNLDLIQSMQVADPLPLTWLNTEGSEALTIALGEALRIGRDWLGVEFLLMGLSKQTDAIFPALLREIGLDPANLRGVLRGMAGGVQKQTWRNQDVAALGADALPQLRQVEPDQLRQAFAAGAEQPPVYTPRLQQVLEAAQTQAGGKQIGHAQLLWALFQQQEALALQIFFSLAHDQNWSRKQVLARLADLMDAKPGAAAVANVPATPPQPAPAPPPVPGLAKYGRDLTAEAQAGKLRPVIGDSARQALTEIGRILLQREANNPLLIGDPGVGKSALVEGFAWRLAGNGNPVVSQLANRRIIELSANNLTAGTKYRGELETRVQQLLATVKAADGQIILFIDEIHSILASSANSGVADALKPALARGEFPCIGATTVAEYRQHIEKDGALARRFTPVWLAEPTAAEALEIVTQVATAHLSPHHGVTFEPAALEAAVRLADRYILDERLPGKAIKLLDKAAAGRIIHGSLSGGAIADATYVGGTVTVDDILAVVAERTNIPISQLGKTDNQRLLDLEGKLQARIIGQDEAISQVAKLVRRAGAGLTDANRPQGVFLLAGPTGVGKTELALALTEALFDRPSAICRLDMSEFMEKYQVARLTGAPPGYIGYGDEGQLTGRLRREPYSVVLLDEMEKAHPDVQHLFLQLFDTGRLTDAQGRVADGRRAFFIMTTNLGAREAAGFANIRTTYEEKLLAAIRKHFTPEFINRIDRIVCFTPLTTAALTAIFDRELGLVQDRLQQEQQITLKLSAAVRDQLITQAAQAEQGARPVRRLIEDQVLAWVVDQLLAGQIAKGQQVTLTQLGAPA